MSVGPGSGTIVPVPEIAGPCGPNCPGQKCSRLSTPPTAVDAAERIVPAMPTNMRCHLLGNDHAVDASTYGVGMSTRNMMASS